MDWTLLHTLPSTQTQGGANGSSPDSGSAGASSLPAHLLAIGGIAASGAAALLKLQSLRDKRDAAGPDPTARDAARQASATGSKGSGGNALQLLVNQEHDSGIFVPRATTAPDDQSTRAEDPEHVSVLLLQFTLQSAHVDQK